MAQKKTITHAIYALIFVWFGWPKIMYFDGKTLDPKLVMDETNARSN